MQSGFNPYFTGSNSGSNLTKYMKKTLLCFNPYFTGSNSGSITDGYTFEELGRFNPYFTGSNSGSFIFSVSLIWLFIVSILILLEVILEADCESAVNGIAL